MKTKANFLSALSLVLAGMLSAQDTWVQLDSVNGPPKSVAVSFEANGKGYIVTGLDFSGFTRKMYSYDVAQNDWDNEQSMGGDNGGGLGRGSAVAFSIYNKGYVCTGQGDNTNFLNDNWEYDPALDQWTQKADFPGTPRRGAVAFVIDDIGYVGTGQDASGLKKDFFRYDPVANIWGAIADFAGTARKDAVGFAMGYQGYVVTGDDGVKKKDLWQYLVFQNMWVQKANFPGTARSAAVGWANFPCAYIGTGEDINSVYTNDFWEYNYFTDSWTQRASLPGPGRKDATAFVINGIAYVGTGYGAELYDDFYGYTGIVSAAELTNEIEVNVYPVPSAGEFFIELKGTVAEKANLHFYSTDGKEVTGAFSVVKSANGFEVNAVSAAQGIYFFRLQTEKGEKAGRVIIR